MDQSSDLLLHKSLFRDTRERYTPLILSYTKLFFFSPGVPAPTKDIYTMGTARTVPIHGVWVRGLMPGHPGLDYFERTIKVRFF